MGELVYLWWSGRCPQGDEPGNRATGRHRAARQRAGRAAEPPDPDGVCGGDSEQQEEDSENRGLRRGVLLPRAAENHGGCEQRAAQAQGGCGRETVQRGYPVLQLVMQQKGGPERREGTTTLRREPAHPHGVG